MTTIRRLIALLAVVLAAAAAAGCSSSGSHADPPRTAVQLAAALGCTDYVPADPLPVLVVTAGSCTWQGQHVKIGTFTDQRAYSDALTVVRRFWQTYAPDAVRYDATGNYWYVTVGDGTDRALTEQAANKLGGTVTRI